MELFTLIRLTLGLAAFLVLLMYVSFLRNRMQDEFSIAAYLANTARSLIFCQVIALVLTLILGGERNTLLISTLYCDGMGLFGYSAIYLAKWANHHRYASFATGQVIEFAATLLGSLSGAAVASVILHLTINEDLLWDLNDPFSFINLMVIGGMVMAALLVASSRMFYNFKLFSERQLQDRQAFEVLRFKEQAVSAKLQAIQTRINPHFLYNALNAITSLVHEDPDRAEQMTLALSRFFRASLSDNNVPFTTIAEEVSLVKTYLEIEETRFGDRLSTSFSIDPAAMNEPVPKFLLQPLVENAVKHGTSKQDSQGRISLEIHKNDDSLEIAIKDNGPPFPEQMMGGYGWKSVSDSLELLYPARHEMRLVNGADKHVHLKLLNKP